MLFQSVSPTRFDLRFSLFGFPVTVHPLFWIIALVLGSTSSGLLGVLLWVIAVFFSVTIHELGHALAFRRYGLDAVILLYIGGGLTIPQQMRWGDSYASVALSPRQQMVISLAGPFAGFAFAALIIAAIFAIGGSVETFFFLGFIPLPIFPNLPIGGSVLGTLASSLLFCNVFWGIFNLLPVFPMDGGQVTRSLLMQMDPMDGVRKSLWISTIAGGLLAAAGLIFFKSIYMAFLFGMMAFQSYQSLNSRFGRY
jgi:Zn-dependent protease